VYFVRVSNCWGLLDCYRTVDRTTSVWNIWQWLLTAKHRLQPSTAVFILFSRYKPKLHYYLLTDTRYWHTNFHLQN